MKIDQALVAHVATLARLNLNPQEIKTYQEDLSKILSYIDTLSAVETDLITPLLNPMREQVEYYTQGLDKRKDVTKESLGAKNILRNAPDSKLNQFKVDAVISDDEF
jgi:aspartyl-tRNA(Asn)/glutamyl-tRNA(Gln) amidotransferase subunit C